MTLKRPWSNFGQAIWIWAATVLACGLMLGMLCWPAFLNKFYIADDLGAFAIPFRHLYMEGLRSGRVDLWSSALFGGFYMHGEGQTGMFHPLHLFLYRFVPFVQAFNLELIAIYCALFAGNYLLFSKWVQDRLAASFGAFVFSFAGTNLMQIVHINQVAIVAHAPWLMIALHNAILGNSRYRTRWSMVVALLNGSELLLGYPFYFLMSAALQVWYVLYLTRGRILSPAVLRAGLGTAIGILIGAIQLAPTWSVLSISTRASPGFSFLSDGSLNPLNLLQWVNPYLFVGRKLGPAGPHELCIYAGVGPLLLFAWLYTKKDDPDRTLIMFLVGLATLGVFLSLGKYNQLFTFYIRLPGLSLFRVPARYMLFTNFALAGASALALNRLRTLSYSSLTRRFKLFMAGLLVLSLCTVVMKIFLAVTANHHRFDLAPARNVLAGTAVVCTGVTLFWFAVRSPSSRWLTLFWAFALCDMTFYSGTYLRRLPAAGLHYYAAESVPVPAPGPIFVAARWNDKLTLGGYRLADGYAGLEPKSVLPTGAPNYLKALGVRAVESERGNWVVPQAPLEPIRLALPFYSDHPAEAMNRVDLTSTAVVTQEVAVDSPASGSVRISEQYPGFLHIAAQTSGRALCVLAQRFHPGWTARINERTLQLLAVDGDLTGFVLPGGKQDVILEFRPKDFFLGRIVTFAALALVLLILGTGLTRRLLTN